MKEEFPIVSILNFLEKEENFVFLESARCDAQNFLSYLFLRPRAIITTAQLSEIKACFAQLDKALKQGYYVAGFLSYEAGESFEEKLRHRNGYDFPLLWFGVYKQPLIYDHRKGSFTTKVVLPEKTRRLKRYLLTNIRPDIRRNSYIKAIARIKDLIAQGYTYQVNYTFKLKFAFSGSAAALYANLRENQSVAYSAFIKIGPISKKGPGPFCVLSFSPELFFKKTSSNISTRPMKGTAGRGKDLAEDNKIAAELGNCLKNRSENLMIVDLLRNDLGKISKAGSVNVPRLFNVEKYRTLFQMTSDIASRLKKSSSVFNIFSHIFPSGSVTGAPKIKTMQIIRQLEKTPRNVYTGSIGFFSPHESGTFNVAIRTLLIDERAKTGEMGVGSGIVYDSQADREYSECRLKAEFLAKQANNFRLIETMLWRPNQGYVFLREHLERLKNSADYFNFVYPEKDIIRELAKGARPLFRPLFKQKSYRVRLLLDRYGKIKIESSLLKPAIESEPRIYISPKRVSSGNPFLYHKTTNRKMYDRQFKRCQRSGFYDVIFANERDEITEGAISNILVRKNGALYTPPVACGLLDGLYRRYLLSSKKFPIRERVLHKQDLIDAQAVYLCNSVRGLVKVRLEAKNH